MSGHWVRRQADEHTCDKPEVTRDRTVRPGDIWQCDGCGQEWRVHQHPLDFTLYFLAIPKVDG